MTRVRGISELVSATPRMVLAGALAILASACQMTPTKVSESHHREFELLVDKARKPLTITEATGLLDARPAFAYGLNHINGAVHFTWEKLVEDSKTEEIIRDKRAGALRLSLMGLRPDVPVIVVDEGLKGGGEAGRVAWLLLYFGFQDVQAASNDLFREFWTPNPTPDPENAPSWDPHVRDEMLLDKAQFANLAEDAKGRLEKRVFILDARAADAYLKASKKISKNQPDIGAINVPWTEFYTKDGRPNPAIRARLESVGVRDGDRIILTGGGVAYTAAYALMALGFKRVQAVAL